MLPSLTEKQRYDIDAVNRIIRKDFNKISEIKKNKLRKYKSESDELRFPGESKEDYKVDNAVRGLL